MSNLEPERAFAQDGIRPVAKSELEVADTFQDAGTRPIEESPDYLVKANSERQETVVVEDDLDKADVVIRPGAKEVISQHPLVEIRNLGDSVEAGFEHK